MSVLIIILNSFCTTAYAWNIATNQGVVTGDTAPEAFRLTADMVEGSDEGFDTDPFINLDKDEDQTEENWASWVLLACA